MQPEEMCDKAKELFKARMHCSQAVAMVGLEKLGLNEPDTIKALGAFGGGIGGCGKTCGALVGAAAIIGALYSRSSLEEKENPRMWAATRKMVERFEELCKQYEGISCQEIAQVDWLNRDQVKTFYTDPESRRQHCIRVVGEASRILGELLEQEQAREAAK